MSLLTYWLHFILITQYNKILHAFAFFVFLYVLCVLGRGGFEALLVLYFVIVPDVAIMDRVWDEVLPKMFSLTGSIMLIDFNLLYIVVRSMLKWTVEYNVFNVFRYTASDTI